MVALWTGERVRQNNPQHDEGGQSCQQGICLPVFVQTCMWGHGAGYQMTDTDSTRTITTSTRQTLPLEHWTSFDKFHFCEQLLQVVVREQEKYYLY